MITSDYVAMQFDATEGWTCVVDGPEGAGALRGQTLTFDFAKGAKSIGLVPAEISLLGEPLEIRLRLRGSSSGHPLRLRIVTHFLTFERTLGPVDSDKLHEIVVPAPPGEGWRWFGGENDGKLHGPLRITGLFLDAAGKGASGQLELVEVRVKSRCPANRTSVLTGELRPAAPAPLFVGVVRSQTAEPFDAKLDCVIRDWDGRTVCSHSAAVRIGSSQPAELAVPVPAGNHVFLEAEFTCQAAGQEIPPASACYVAPVPAGGSAGLDPGSPFGMGVYLYRYSDPELMDRAAQMARDIGVKWSREELLWSVIEPRKGQFDWSFYDRVVATAKRHSISVYGLLDYWSDWTRPYTPEGIEDYCRYVRAVLERYKSDIHHWEVWNEPNIFFWQGPKDMYADLLQAAYKAIKQADPTAEVAGCSTSGIDLDFVRRVMKLGGPFDILTVHPYRDELLDRPFIQELQQAAAEIKKPDGQVRPVWITEIGWGTHMPHNAGKSGTYVTPRQQACLLARTYVDALASKVTPNISWYDFRNDGTNLLEWEHNLGIITQDFQPKPACRAYATLTTMLVGRQVQEELKLGEDVLAFRFAKPGGSEPVIVLWSIKKPRTVSLHVAEPAVLTNLMGQTHNLPAEVGKAKVDLAPGVPVFVRSGGTGAPAFQPADQEATNAAQNAFATGCGEWYGLFNLPSAQHRDGKTYVVYPNSDQNPVAVCYDHSLKRWSEPVVVSRRSLRDDSHGNPAMLIDQKGFLHVFHGCHGGPMRYARSTRPQDVSEWVEQPDPAPHATYPQVMQMANGRIDLFYRAGVHTDDWVYRTSDDGGEKWSAETAIIDGVAPREAWYANFAKGPDDTVHVGFVWKDDTNELKAPGPEFIHRYDLFHMRRDSDGVWRTASGDRLALPLSRADANRLCKVYDSQARQEFTGGCSVGVDKHGHARLLFRTAAAYGTTVYQDKFASWNGKAWTMSDVGPGVNCGFADFPRDDNFLLQVLPSGKLRAFIVNITAGKPVRTALEQWDGSEGGRKWKRMRMIFRSTDHPAAYLLIAPKLVVDAHPDAWLVFGLRRRYLFGDAGYLGR